MIYPIVVYGDPVLKKPADDLTKDGEVNIPELVANMFETMYNAGGIGLAAPQIGLSHRIFVVDGSPIEEEGMMDFKKVFINPEIIWEEGKEWAYEEGCLSIPGIREDVMRHPKVRLNYMDENFKEYEEEFEGMKARIIQHEYDHIEGILFIDHLTPFKKRILKGKLGNITKGKCDADYKIRIPKKK